jgi:hypothetical protein
MERELNTNHIKHFVYLITPELKTTRVKKFLRFLRLISKRKETRITLYCEYEGGYINLWEGWGFGSDTEFTKFTMRVLEYITVYKDGSSEKISFT